MPRSSVHMKATACRAYLYRTAGYAKLDRKYPPQLHEMLY